MIETQIAWLSQHPWLTVAAAVIVAGLLTTLSWVTVRFRQSESTPDSAIIVAAVAAMGCTAYSADTSWRFAGDHLGMLDTGERIFMFAVVEFSLLACALLARRNLNSSDQTPGAPGTIVWFITAVQVIPAFSETDTLAAGIVRAVAGPIMAAILWHLAMGIDLKHRKPGAVSHSAFAQIRREVQNIIFSRLGLSERGRDAAQMTRDRATERAVRYAAHLARNPKGFGHKRMEKRLASAVARAQVGADAEQRAELMQLLSARRNALSLATVTLPSPWKTDIDALTPGTDTSTDTDTDTVAETDIPMSVPTDTETDTAARTDISTRTDIARTDTPLTDTHVSVPTDIMSEDGQTDIPADREHRAASTDTDAGTDTPMDTSTVTLSVPARAETDTRERTVVPMRSRGPSANSLALELMRENREMSKDAMRTAIREVLPHASEDSIDKARTRARRTLRNEDAAQPQTGTE